MREQSSTVDRTVHHVNGVDEVLVRALVREQFPEWANLPIARVAHQGWDNRSFRLGDEMVVRLPSATAYAAQVEKEQEWLPVLAAALSRPIPDLVCPLQHLGRDRDTDAAGRLHVARQTAERGLDIFEKSI